MPLVGKREEDEVVPARCMWGEKDCVMLRKYEVVPLVGKREEDEVVPATTLQKVFLEGREESYRAPPLPVWSNGSHGLGCDVGSSDLGHPFWVLLLSSGKTDFLATGLSDSRSDSPDSRREL